MRGAIERIIKSTDTMLYLIFCELRIEVGGEVYSRFTGGRIGIHDALQEDTFVL